MSFRLLVLVSLAAGLGWAATELLKPSRPIRAGESAAQSPDDPAVAASSKATSLFLPDNGPSEQQYPQLHNLMQVTDRIYSGAEPKTEEAYRQLAELGVKVIVSVDGARPDVELAAQYGMRYIHIPIGYDGFDAQSAKSFARVADEVDQTIYVHCHHGKHRGPAGAAAICVARGDADGELGLKILERGGTSKNYAGLWRAVKEYQRPGPDEKLPLLVPIAEVGSLAAAMANIDRASDNLKLLQVAGWRPSADHPDIAPRQEALLLKEGFRETVRQLQEVNDYDEQLLEWMKQAEESAGELESALEAGDTVSSEARLAVVQEQCHRCHKLYRD